MRAQVSLENVKKAAILLSDVALKTPLMRNENLAQKFSSNIVLKREDLQQVRSYKIRGAYNKIASLSQDQLNRGVVCASAGNHAQGVAFSCFKLKVKGVVFMPTPTPKQKIEQVKMFGGAFIEIVITGDTFDDASFSAKEYCADNKMSFVHPFDDEKVIEGQATIALEILEQSKDEIDYLFLPVGGGGVAAGMSSIFNELSPNTKVIGIEPSGAPSMSTSLENGVNVKLDHIDKFVDGASVQRVGDLNFDLCQQYLSSMALVKEGEVCQTILDLYNKDAIVVEPAGALTIAALNQFKDEIQGKNIVCLVSGSNNDITRTEEIKERALLHANLKHYFIISFPQRSGALKEFVADVLGPNDDITYFEFSKKSFRPNTTALVGIEVLKVTDYQRLVDSMKSHNFKFDYLNNKQSLFEFLI